MRVAAVLAAFCVGVVFVGAGLCEDNERANCPSMARDRGPTLISDLQSFRKAVRAEGYVGRVLVHLTVTEKGSARDPRITSPARLNSVSSVTDQILDWRFCPAVKYSKYKAATVQFVIDVRDDF